MLAMKDKEQSKDAPFQLDNQPASGPQFQLENLTPAAASTAVQTELFLPLTNPEAPEHEQQLEFEGLAKPIYALQVEGVDKPLRFHYADNLLESLEAQDVQVHYECRDGYCGACRTDLIEGEVAYLQAPTAWINQGEILPCCCVPKSPLKLKLKG
ncbi:MAG: class I ribonucleotide reductase maintenance protein YfaE [Bermanella sp.]